MKLRKWAALVLALAMLLLTTGCIGNFYKNAGTINGVEISSGLYLMAQYTAFSEARANEAIDREKDIFAQTLDGKSTSDWIGERTVELLRRYVAVRAMCREKGLQLDETAQQNLQQMSQYWSALEEMYANNGIAYNTFERFYTTDEMSRILFKALYADGGELAVPDEELKKEYAEQYAHVRAYSIALNSLEDGVDVQADTLALVAAAAEKLNAGDMTLEQAVEKELPAVYELTGREFDPTSAPAGIYSNYIPYQPENYDTYSETFVTDLKAQGVGDFGYYDMGGTAILYEVVATFADDAEFEAEKPAALERLKMDDYEEYLRSVYDTYAVEWLPFVRTYFRPSKIQATT